jgi:Tfp pilus assembly PilM family ATPase
MNLRSLLRQPVLAVAIHDSEARWTLGRPGRVTAVGSVPLPPHFVDDGVIVDPAAAGEALRAAPGFPGRRRMRVVAALPAQRSVFRTLELPALRGKQFTEMAEREIRREMPMLADNAYVSWTRTTEHEGKVRVFVIGVARDVLDSHIATLRAARLTPVAADLRVIAAARAVAEPDCIIAHLESEEIELAIFRSGVPAIVRYVAMSASVDDPAWGQQLTEELVRTLKFYRDSHRDEVEVDAFPISLVGGAAPQALFSAGLAAQTGHEVTMPQLRIPIRPDSDTARFAANVGLALKDLAA